VQAHELIFTGAGIVDCGRPEDYAVGDIKLFRDGNFYVTRVHEGFLALSRWCTHMNSLITYQAQHWRFWCPMHVATFDRRGSPTCSTGNHGELNALRIHPISFSGDGHILVNSDEVIEREAFKPDDAVLPPDQVAGV